MKSPLNQQLVINIFLAILMIGFGIGISRAYEQYKGTGLSRLPQSGPSNSNPG